MAGLITELTEVLDLSLTLGTTTLTLGGLALGGFLLGMGVKFFKGIGRGR